MDIRTKEIMETAAVPSNEGLIVSLDTSLLFKVDASQASHLYQTVGPDYVDVIVAPNLRSAIRSPNAKVVIIGSGDNGLPIILGGS